VGLQFNGLRHKRQNNDKEPTPSDQQNSHQSMIQRMAVTNKLAYANALGALIKWSVVDRLDAIKCPTLMITSDEDFVPVSIKEGYASKMPCAELVVINNSRHATPRECTEEFNAILLEFVSKH
jgi:3-oxoadipate enol-lactonase